MWTSCNDGWRRCIAPGRRKGMECSSCGTNASADAEFRSGCGARLETSGERCKGAAVGARQRISSMPAAPADQ